MNGEIGIFLYVKFYGYDEETGDDIDLNEKDMYTLLDIVEDWWEEKDAGLARFLDKELKEYIKAIEYTTTRKGPYIKFHVKFDNKYNENTKIEYEGKKQTLYEIVKDFIQGQITDGWGENGIYVIPGGMIGLPAKCVVVEPTFYEPDLEKSRKIEEKITKRKVCFVDFERFPAFKEIK